MRPRRYEAQRRYEAHSQIQTIQANRDRYPDTDQAIETIETLRGREADRDSRDAR
jgi:hypothetical protein